MTGTEMAAWVQAAAAIASLLVALVLARLTWVYVRHTRRMADQMVTQSQPILIGRIEPLARRYAQYVITNVGLGPALNVEMTMRVDGHSATWRDRLFEPAKSEMFHMPFPDTAGTDAELLSELAKNGSTFSSTITYEDRNGQNYTAKCDVDFQQLLEDWDRARWSLPESEMTQLTRAVEKGFESIEKTTLRTLRQLSGVDAPKRGE